MTTQHEHHEHSDVDASVVEHSSASENETMAASAAPEIDNTPAETNIQAESSSEEVADSADKQDEAVAETTSTSEQESVADGLASPEHVESTEVPFVSPSTQETTDNTDDSATVETSAVHGEPEGVHEEPEGEILSESEAVALTDTIPVEMSTNPANESTSNAEQGVEPVTPVTATEEGQTENAESVAEQKEEVTENIPEPQTPEFVAEQPVQSELEGAQPVQETLPEAAAVEEKTDGQELPIADTTFPYVEGSGLIDAAKAEEVRPFTDFIAEFRQAEAALQATLRDSQVEALSILSSVASNLVQEDNQSALVESPELSTGEADTAASQSEQPFVADQKSEEKSEAVRSEEEPKPVTRPVSPLLRPASRLRLPRHGFGRHAREEQQTPAAEETTTPVAKSDAPAEATPEAPAPRPARRYRFDRPAASTASSNVHTPSRPDALSRSTSAPSQPKAEEKPVVNNQRAEEQPANAVQTPEPQTTSHKKHNNTNGNNNVAQEAESTPVIHSTETHGRRRHSQKEQPAAVNEPVVETPAPVLEQTASSKEDVAPEDLPPLEYSELQKASSRRRRRHRSGSSNTGSHTTQSSAHVSDDAHVPPAPAPIAAPAPMPAPPARTPAAVDNSDNNQLYTIVSGYTVNQMNQGNDVTGPFMAPEPSPARGSVMSRDGRNTRAEARPSSTPSLYPSTRSADNGFSAAAMNQFGNVVSQALQTQTDRMVTEFRRISQAPTNVSVTLPPFPSTERVGVFVDVANLLYSARTLRMGVDFGKLLDFLRGNRRLIRAHAYCPTSPQAGDEQMFLQAVKGLGYRITTKNYKTFSSGAKKADLDLDLCMDVVRLVDGGAVDCIVLVSGDSDFMPMLDYCSDHGVRVEVAAFDEAMSATLRQSCDLFINLSMLEEIRV
ncbi:hypothetical protein KDW_23340 [Dictyobacter vulcani]|uniref:NYN domain-containing protein n=1 Tax=Dictyobacter vulcani TaxID=2607529 RepID=A0A5J4KM17_9CHLR|nr:NYN domain-containing protein [Dictyobacter vulcani]GER88172.1 hypothetical protein KDW_23340 [Dictyobacter vulcani]